MRNAATFVSTITAILLLASSAWSEPRLAFDNPVHDFGKINQGVTVNHVFTFRNTGDAPAVIERVSSSCGCTVANVSSKVIQPGKSGEIKASFDSTDFSGPISKDVFVYLGATRKPPQTLTLKGTVVEEVSVSPKQVMFGTVRAGASTDAVLKIENQGNRTVRITAVKSGMPQLTASTSKNTLKPGESASIKVTVKPGSEGRYLSGYLTIVTDNRARPEKVIPVYAVVQR